MQPSGPSGVRGRQRMTIVGGRGSRLIAGQPLLPDIEEPEPPA